MKKCYKCNKIKNLEDFHKNKDKKQGVESRCKLCRNFLAGQNSHKRHLSKKEYYIKNPWLRNYQNAKQRCTNPKRRSYKSYGGRGIRFLLTVEDVKTLWFRDEAFKMDKPSIDRIDNDGHYEFGNCRFIEVSENSRKGNIERARKTKGQYDGFSS